MSTPDGLHASGTALWESLGQVAGTPAGAIALEACRSADRLDELARVIEGKGVLNLMSFRLDLDLEDEVTGDRHIHVEVKFGAVLAEARQQQSNLKGLLQALGLNTKPAEKSSGEEASPLAQVLALVQSGSQPAGGAS